MLKKWEMLFESYLQAEGINKNDATMIRYLREGVISVDERQDIEHHYIDADRLRVALGLVQGYLTLETFCTVDKLVHYNTEITSEKGIVAFYDKEEAQAKERALQSVTPWLVAPMFKKEPAFFPWRVREENKRTTRNVKEMLSQLTDKYFLQKSAVC